MQKSHTRSGWLTPRFFAISFAFWTIYGLLSIGAAYLAWEELPNTLMATLWQQSWPLGVYALATPPLFECAHRLGRERASASSYYLRLLLATVVAAVAMAVPFSLAFIDMGHDPWQGFWQLTVVGTTWLFHFAAILGSAVAINQFRFAQIRREELLSAQLRALRSQLQPHFLFNTLQAIATTTKRDPNAAVGMLTLLGDLLRQTLQERDGELISLAEEEQLLHPYLELQRLRFADRLQVTIDLPTDVLRAAVPDLILQPLVENALQHGIESMPGKGSIRVRARHSGDFLEIEVADDGPGPDREGVTDGIGLGATRARLAALFGDRAELTLLPGDVSGTVVLVRIPWQEVGGAR